MRPIVCPTITAEPKNYLAKLDIISSFATRIHIDVADGKFAPSHITKVDQITMPPAKKTDIHVMYRRPLPHARTLLSYQPNLVIIHAESEGFFIPFAHIMHKFNIGVGVALLPETSVESIAPALRFIDHVLIFSGNLGHQGGSADLSLLGKVQELRSLKPSLEIGWDGGINDRNIQTLINAGVDILNVGGYISEAESPERAYAKLKALSSPRFI